MLLFLPVVNVFGIIRDDFILGIFTGIVIISFSENEGGGGREKLYSNPPASNL